MKSKKWIFGLLGLFIILLILILCLSLNKNDKKTFLTQKSITKNLNEYSNDYEIKIIDNESCNNLEQNINDINIKIKVKKEDFCLSTIIIDNVKIYEGNSVKELIVYDKTIIVNYTFGIDFYNALTKKMLDFDILNCINNKLEVIDNKVYINEEYNAKCKYPLQNSNKFDDNNCANYRDDVKKYVSERKYELEYIGNGNFKSKIISEKMLIDDHEKYEEFMKGKNC